VRKNEVTPCPSRDPVLTWTNEAGIARGRCPCGHESALLRNGRMRRHSRVIRGFSTPSLVGYVPEYSEALLENWEDLIQCDECGALISDEDIHNEWHHSVVDDFNLLRKQIESLKDKVVEVH
jgi:hypothetical protein